MKKIIALVLALAMVLMVGAAFADTDPAPTSGTITVTNASIGQEYAIYKILDATYSGDAVTYTTTTPSLFAAATNADGESVACPFTVATSADSDGKYAVSSTASVNAINAWITAALSRFSPAVDTQTITVGNTITFDGLDFGYYYITSGLGANVTINSAVPTASVIDKNPTQPDEPEKEDDEETAGIGDVVHFTVTFNATNYYKASAGDTEGTQITEYYVNDTPDGYDIDVTSLQVSVDGTDITELITNEAIDSDTGALNFTIPWVNAEGKSIYASPAEVVFTYSGTVNADAVDGQADNTVTITNDADNTPKSDHEDSKNYKITVIKVDNDDTTARLSGAEFKLYRGSVDDANLVSLAEITDGYRVAYGDATTVDHIVVNESTIIKGLDGNDTYYLVETKAPEGYTLDPTPHQVDFKSVDGTNVTYADRSETITNPKGTVLPSTGGIGTTIFYILGGLLVVGAAVILVARRKAQD